MKVRFPFFIVLIQFICHQPLSANIFYHLFPMSTSEKLRIKGYLLNDLDILKNTKLKKDFFGNTELLAYSKFGVC